MFFSVLFLLCLCGRLFICALWSPTGEGLTSWLAFVVSNCEFVIGIVRPANRDWACQTERCHTLSNKTSLQ